ncbi:hypothetical protein [Yinghuangia sp. YIM S09857]|uniref:hypothetical protein n=1 Tax=Yinghuangia sp. YIM S09857 TaxID=3436929 RepID=UPI003F52A947
MNQVGQHLGRTAGGGTGLIPEHAPGGRPGRVRSLTRELVHGGVRDRSAATWLLASVLTLAWLAAMAWALQAEASAPRPGSAAVLLGGWSLTLLPVHCAARFRRAARAQAGAPVDAAIDARVGEYGRVHDEGADRDESPPAPPGLNAV